MSTAPRQHTPGPWYLNPRGWVVQSTGDIVTRLECSNNKDWDAILIASAPELLAELERTEASLTAILCSRVIDSTTSTWLELRRNRDAIRAAIARATGGNAL